MLPILLLVISIALPNVASAAYDTAAVHIREPLPNGLVKFTIRFTGNAGEPMALREYTMVPASTAQETNQNLRRWVDSVLTQLNLSVLAANTPALAAGQTINPLAPVAVTPSPKSVWRGKVHLYDSLVGKGYTGSLATAITALKEDIEATYQAGFLND